MGWGQVGQHRASGHKGGLGITGMMKHHYSTMLKDYPDHFGHNSTTPPNPNITKKWASIRDLDDLFAKIGKQEDRSQQESVKIIDLATAGYEKLLGGGSVTTPYVVRVGRFTASAEEKVKAAGGNINQQSRPAKGSSVGVQQDKPTADEVLSENG